MDSCTYPLPPHGVHKIPLDQLDTRPDTEIDHEITHPGPVQDDKNVWFFWHSGYETMHPYTKRNIRAWYRRLSKQGWVIRVLNRQPHSPLNVSHFLDVQDPSIFPQAFIDGTIGGHHIAQHTSDLVRFPLLVTYGGVYADVGLLMIGDLDRLWRETVAKPDSAKEVISFRFEEIGLTNYFLCARRKTPFFERCHRLFLKLWEGRNSTEGMWKSPLLKGVPVLESPKGFEQDGRSYSKEEASHMLTDYITQGQVISLVLGLVDEEGGWNGPEYAAQNIYAMDYMVGSQLINEMTAWNGPRAFELMSLSLPGQGEKESEDQQKAREIVEACLSRSFAFKLAHGLILAILGDTLGSLWRRHEGSDDVPNTYAHWLRYGILHWTQDEIPPAHEFGPFEPFKTGPLLSE
ncbi:Capsule polysaccharide biosynthesis protein [Penicillium ucsense]|uniref:Capsule polysaccharide biosynthesis protein n=1 Tax=Penicillium ucsense TaxID=2839758 RepID=A0A8J8VY63_9EURO|nr:Capsule polysaccharide biosynthesis protein [Penicillium ucsense]KAF7730335.1 Capsule polysaccharide biosynthesis protein [Penicillium ucsense]